MQGLYSGNEVLFNSTGYKYKLITRNGVRGFNIPVNVTVCPTGHFKVTLNGNPVEVKEVYCSTETWERLANYE